MVNREVEARIAAVRGRYLQKLSRKAEEIEQTLARLPDSTDHLATLAHRLAGSAGMHDLTELAERAATLEQACLAQDLEKMKERADSLIAALHAAAP